MAAAVNRLRRLFRRRHRYSRQVIDTVGWPHPRPPRDPRLLALNVCLPWVSFNQIVAGPAPSTVQSQAAFSYTATVLFAALMIVSSALVFYSAFVRSQWWSWGLELAGCAGFTFVFFMYSATLVQTIDEYNSSNGFGWAMALLIGNAWRAAQLAPRLW